MDIDYNSAESVKKIISETGLSKFIIHKAGYNKNTSPVFEFVNPNAKNKDCILAFEKWANITHNSNAYEISLFDDFEKSHYESQENSSGGRPNKKNKLVKFTFCLMNIPEVQTQINGNNNQQQQQQSPVDTAKLIADAIEQYEKKREAETLQIQLKAMNDKIDAFMNGDDEEDEEEEEEEKSEEMNAKTMFVINKIEDLLERTGVIPKKAISTISGAEAETKTENKSFDEATIKSINESILRLAKKDKNIVKHLKLLADLCENKPEMYQTAIEMLIKM